MLEPAPCDKSCTSGACVQSNFTRCNVNCNNTGVTSIVETCQSAIFHDKSVVTCNAGACRSAIISDKSTVECTGVNSCLDSTVLESTATCSEEACGGAHFYSSAVTCDEYASCSSAAMPHCTCCDGAYCYVPGTPSCLLDTLGFCSSTYLGQNCQEWRNPACDGLTVAPSGNKVTICEKGDCQNQVFNDTGVLCDNRNGPETCQQADFSDSWVDCNAGACVDANFTNSNVQCYDTINAGGTCSQATFVRSSVACDRRYLPRSSSTLHEAYVCDNVDFYASAMTCGYGACENAWGFRCSCCDGDGCPFGIYDSCTLLPEQFCSKMYAGRTCKEWGNPACKDVVVDETGLEDEDITICAQGDCAREVFTDAAVLCDNTDFFGAESTCLAINVTKTALECESGACQAATIVDSTVRCYKTRGSPSCTSSSISRSTAKCWDESCRAVSFVASAVSCYVYGACYEATFDACSCCDGEGCPSGSLSCTGDLTSLCTSSCAGQGHPLCIADNSASVSTAAAPTTPGPVATTTTTLPTASPVAPTTAAPLSLPPVTATKPPAPNNKASASTTTSLPPVTATSSPTAPPVASTSVPFSSPATITDTKMNSTVLETTSNIAVDIPRIAGDNETQAVVNNPQNGNVIVQADGTLTYTPNDGFEGEDSFDVQVCDVNQNACKVIVLTVVIVQPISNQSPSSSDSWTSSNVVYSLALLALVPIVAIVIVYAQRSQRNDQEQGKPMVVGTLQVDKPTPPFDVEPSFHPTSRVLPAEDKVHPATATSDSTTAGDNVEAANDSPTERPVRQVPYQEVNGGLLQQVSSLSVIDEQRAQFKQDDPPSIHHDNANPQRFLPDHKDQCRSVLPANRPPPRVPSGPEPIAEAVLVVDVKPSPYEEQQIGL